MRILPYPGAWESGQFYAKLLLSSALYAAPSCYRHLPEDIPLPECEAHMRRLIEKGWNASGGDARQARTVVLKRKAREFSLLHRSLTPRKAIVSCDSHTNVALTLRERFDLPPQQLYRLVGIDLVIFEFEEDVPDGSAATRVSSGPLSELILKSRQ